MTWQKDEKSINWEKSNNDSCPGKKTFLTWKHAATHNNRMSKRGSAIRAKGKKIDRLHVYKCKKCGLFHIGHAARKKRTLKDFPLND